MEEVERPLHGEAGWVQGVLVGREASTQSAEEESMLREWFCWFNDAQYVWMLLFPRPCNRLKGKGSQWKSNADDMSPGGRFTMKPRHVSFRGPYLQGSFWGLGRGPSNLVCYFAFMYKVWGPHKWDPPWALPRPQKRTCEWGIPKLKLP